MPKQNPANVIRSVEALVDRNRALEAENKELRSTSASPKNPVEGPKRDQVVKSEKEVARLRSSVAKRSENAALRKTYSLPSPLKSIRKNCLVCANGRAEVARCQIHDCAFWPYRFGKGPTKDILEEWKSKKQEP